MNGLDVIRCCGGGRDQFEDNFFQLICIATSLLQLCCNIKEKLIILHLWNILSICCICLNLFAGARTYDSKEEKETCDNFICKLFKKFIAIFWAFQWSFSFSLYRLILTSFTIHLNISLSLSCVLGRRFIDYCLMCVFVCCCVDEWKGKKSFFFFLKAYGK